MQLINLRKEDITLEKKVNVFMKFKNEEVKTDNKHIDMITSEFSGDFSKTLVNKMFIDDKIVDVIVMGLGKREELTTEKCRVLGGNITKVAKVLLKKTEREMTEMNLVNLDLDSELREGLFEGLLLGNYEFEKYKSKKNTKHIETVNVAVEESLESEVCEEIKRATNLATATIIARDLVNEPANIIYPETLANEVVKLGKDYGFEVEVYEEDKIAELGMEAFLAVGKGSINKPRFIVMRYMNDSESDEILGLVGKGLTYDSGGYSIKPTNSMMEMKTDMGGAASVIGAMCAIANNKLQKNVIAVVAACENLISANAYKPGDIINSMGKKTIEIVNTDAEGRLTLIDAVHYIINNEKATNVVDIATLTGGVIVALGNVASGIVTNNDDFYKELEAASKLSGEKIWRMPVFDEFKKSLKGKDADLKNSTGRDASCICAGLFIGEFVGNTPWLHIDIAGTSTTPKSEGYKEKGATGEGVRTLYHLANLN